MTNCWILSTPRTGGNYLSVILNETKLFPVFKHNKAFEEWFNVHYRFSAKAFEANPCMCNNLHHGQFVRVYKDKLKIEQLVPNIRYIYLKRKSLIEQAASFYIAKHSQTWRLYNDAAKSKFCNQPIPIDKDSLVEVYNTVKKFDGAWDEYLLGIPHHVVFYEDLRDNTEATVNGIMDYLSLSKDNVKEAIQKAGDGYKSMKHPYTDLVIKHLQILLTVPSV